MSRLRLLVLHLAALSAGAGAFACGDGATEPAASVPPPVGTVAVTQATALLSAPGATAQLEATVRDHNGQEMTGEVVTWSSSAPTVATVDASGLVSAVENGVATITATVGTVSGTANVTVASSDRAALVALYEATDGPNWVDNTNWLTDAPIGEWYGVDTNSAGRVVVLSLAGNTDNWPDVTPHGLEGPIPPELGSLAKLKWLNLSRNALTGPIPPELGGLASLELLALNSNSLTGPMPPEIGNLTNLKRLYLYGNDLTGPIPSELGGLANLEQLELNSNDLTGSIPPELGDLTKLERLYLGSNDLTGPIPPELGGLANLKRLYLDNGDLTGPIPPDLGRLADLERLYLYANSLTGPIPPDLGDLANLERLYLRSNELTGPVPSELGDLTNLERLHLADNAFTGPLPSSLARLTKLGRFYFEWNPGLCAPGVASFADWLGAMDEWRGAFCNESDTGVLESLFESAGGSDWTNAQGWLQGPVLAGWHGVAADSLGRVTVLDLSGNALAGRLPASISALARLTELRIANNPHLAGRLPLSLADLPLRALHYATTDLCTPVSPSFQRWLSAIPSHDGTGAECPPLSDREALEALYDATSGPEWTRNKNWLTNAPLGEWDGVEADDQGRVVGIRFTANGLVGRIPPELGDLAHLRSLNLYWDHRLTGPIPPELGNLANLRNLIIESADLTGPIPPELGNLANLRRLKLHENRLTGSIPTELASLANLRTLYLGRNNLTGELPPELGDLAELRELNVASNGFTGRIPATLGDLTDLESLYLGDNELTGPLPPQFGGLPRLRTLALQQNPNISGALPNSLINLAALETLQTGDTGLCAPSDAGFLEWLEGVANRRVAVCDGASARAYLIQTIQSREFPVPLVAGEEALLRVFVTAGRDNAERIPPVRASFLLNGILAHVANVPGKPGPIPTKVEDGSLAVSANAVIPGEVVQPGLQLIVDVDPHGTLDPGLGVAKRIPETGLLPVEVREMPVLDLTVIPFLWSADPDSAILGQTAGMATDPDGHELLAETRALLPVGAIEVTAHEPVWSSSNSAFELLDETEAIRVLEGGDGHYMGMMSGHVTGAGGVAALPGRSNFSQPYSGVVAHELGHNMNLWHAPCGGAAASDPAFPYQDGSSGAWGYDWEGRRLVRPNRLDLMGYCRPKWISDYHFSKALRFRLVDEGTPASAAAQTRSLLLWGGVDSVGAPFLEPAFVVDAPPVLPDSVGQHRLTGRSATGGILFSLGFTMPVVADGDGRSSFAFALPVQPGWEALSSVTLTGPGGSATLDADSGRPMAILRNPRNGQVRGILRDLPLPTRVAADEAAADAGPGLEVLFSRGIPDAGAWTRR